MNVRRFPLTVHEDDRGWFTELIRASALPKPIKQANLSRSRKGVIRGLHYHERGQDDLFVCLEGMVRVVVLDRPVSRAARSSTEADDNPVALLRARGCPCPRLRGRGLTAASSECLRHAHCEYDPADPDEHGVPWDDERVRHLWSTTSPVLSARDASS